MIGSLKMEKGDFRGFSGCIKRKKQMRGHLLS
jgi:hypothetical protein